jgi:uncharacterized delta-60 repeat protein
MRTKLFCLMIVMGCEEKEVESQDECETPNQWFSDSDGDGFGNVYEWQQHCEQPEGYVSDSSDCNDLDPNIHPETDEYCDGLDNDCDGIIDPDSSLDAIIWYLDSDNDEYGDSSVTLQQCDQPYGHVDNNLDCDDANGEIHPAATESCDGTDNDCDEEIDEGVLREFYGDDDGDGYGDPTVITEGCTVTENQAENGLDCDDTNADIHPTAIESCDEIDNDCDGVIDPDSSIDAITWYIDYDSDGYGSSLYSQITCSQPVDYVDNDLDCDDLDASICPGGDEYCDGLDNDCDGDIDPDSSLDAITWYLDSDGDGDGDGNSTMLACSQPSTYVSNNLDCDDANDSIFVGAAEICNNIDEDCDGDIDEQAIDVISYFLDTDADGFGSDASATSSCSLPSNASFVGGDCDDTNNLVGPNAIELCDGIDNDCDGVIDPDSSLDALIWYLDSDADSYGLATTSYTACSQPAGYSGNDMDCDDLDSSINPAAAESCDGIDNDCDGVIDPDSSLDAVTWYIDYDSDNYGSSLYFQNNCSQPVGYIDNDLDCDDLNSSINPGVDEYCDGFDNDCDGVIDPDSSVDALIWYLDSDADGYGLTTTIQAACSQPAGYTDNDLDCDDLEGVIYPGADELCDGLDNDCNGIIDPDSSVDASAWYLDDDLDGFGDANVSLQSCAAPIDYIAEHVDGYDCDDSDIDVFPGMTEVCNGIDDNCDGLVDETGDAGCGTDEVCDEGMCVPACANGAMDTSFGVNGIVQLDMGGDDYLEGMDVQSDGSILVTGNNDSQNFMVARFTADGVLDNTFGGTGIVETSFSAPARTNAVRVQSDGKILVVGSTHISCSLSWNRYALARYNTDGSLDSSFGSNGTQTTNWGSVGSHLHSIAFQSDDSIIVGGNRYAGGCSPGISNSSITRYTPDGQLDSSFGSGGELRYDIPYGPHHDNGRTVVVAPDDSIYLGANESYGSWAGLVRADANGSFQGLSQLSTGYIKGVVLDTQGVIATSDSAMGRFDLSGNIDTSFASSGYVNLTYSPGGSGSNPLMLDQNGNILVVVDSSNNAIEVARHLSDGSLDTSFGNAGIAEWSGNYTRMTATTLAEHSDGGVLVGGYIEDGNHDFVIVKFCQ